MIELLLLAQAMSQSLDTRSQAEVPATAFRCTFVRQDENDGSTDQFDLQGSIPAAPAGHQPNDSFRMVLASSTGSSLAGPARANPQDATDWFREYQIRRLVGTETHIINLKLRREGRSVGYTSVFDAGWNTDRDYSEYEPYRYDAAGLCAADFAPEGQGQ